MEEGINEFYRQVLGLKSPWTVTSVTLDMQAKRVDVWVRHDEGVRWPCPDFGDLLITYDHVEERAWHIWTPAT